MVVRSSGVGWFLVRGLGRLSFENERIELAMRPHCVCATRDVFY